MQDQHLLIDVAIILTAAFPIQFLARRLKLPAVFSYLVTGVVIGPHALAWIDDTAQVETIAELGVALILFFIGLHIPLERVRALGRTTLVSGSLQMIFTVLIVTGASMLLNIPLHLGVFYGLLVSLSSTAVVLPILATRDEMGAPFARKFLGVSIFQDFAVIPLMLLVPAFAIGADSAPPLDQVVIRVTLAIVGVVVLVAVARFIVPRLFELIARLGTRESFTAAAIVLIVATIALTHQLGISAALGAFAAGVVIAETDYVHEIFAILRPFRDFLSALFFASIGMLLDPRFVAGNPLLVIGTVLAAVAIKVLAAYPAIRSSASLPRTSIRAAFAIAPVGEFSFLLSQAAKEYRILGPWEEQLFISTAVITLAGAPLLISAGTILSERFRSREEPTETDEGHDLRSHIVIVGYGLNGQNVARVLSQTGIPHVVLEEDVERAAAARLAGSKVILTDGADPDGLSSAGVERALAVIVAISDSDGTRRIVKTVRGISPTVRLIVRTRYVAEVDALRALGADEVIPEEFETSIEIVVRALRVFRLPGNIVAAQLRILRDEGYRMLRDPEGRTSEGRRLSAIMGAGTSETFLAMPDSFVEGKTFAELQLEQDHIAVPVVIRDGKPISPPPQEERIVAGDTLILVGSHEDLVRVTARLEKAV
ncbi:MAG TPA: cation:proton antiporter [Thermoanaerobaculia bacterium]|nr:cation:proton antiporter [Thermoanaerobaculia bacterium]